MGLIVKWTFVLMSMGGLAQPEWSPCMCMYEKYPNLSDVSNDWPGARGGTWSASEGTRPKLFLLSWSAKEFMATLAVLFEKAMSIRVEPSDLEKVPHTSRPRPASRDSQTAFGLATAVQGGPTEFNIGNLCTYYDVLVISLSILFLQFFKNLITTVHDWW